MVTNNLLLNSTFNKVDAVRRGDPGGDYDEVNQEIQADR